MSAPRSKFSNLCPRSDVNYFVQFGRLAQGNFPLGSNGQAYEIDAYGVELTLQ